MKLRRGGAEIHYEVFGKGPAIEHQSMETAVQAQEIVQGRAPKGAVNAQHWTRKSLLKR